MRQTALWLALACLSTFVLVLPSAAATHVPLCWTVQRTLDRVGESISTGDIPVPPVDGSQTCFVDCVWDAFTMARIKYVLQCTGWLT